MKDYEKRHFCGCLMPNIFFLLQICMVLLLLLVSLEMISILDASPFSVYVFAVIALLSIIYFNAERKKVIKRQYKYCDEFAKNKKNLSRQSKKTPL